MLSLHVDLDVDGASQPITPSTGENRGDNQFLG
jgi:hypothetical protein